MFILKTPKGELVKVKGMDGKVGMEIRWNPNFGPEMTETINDVQQFIDSEVLRLCDDLVPKDTGILKQSGIMHTQIGSGQVKYRTPYARRWYYMPANFQEGSGNGKGATGRGNYWFERMKQKGGKQQILKGAKKLAGRKQ